MKFLLQKIYFLLFLSCSSLFAIAQTNTTYTSVTQLKIPNGVSLIGFKVSGGAGGYGGTDGAGNTNAAAGSPGYVDATFSVTPGDIIDIYPGGAGGNGANSAANSGGGTGGVRTYAAINYNGGAGGNAGGSGTSGGGGGGGAATIVTLNGTIIIVAGGASGGGGMANLANSGRAGNNTISANGTLNRGATGAAAGSGNDGGGGGAGGGGQYGSIGGTSYKTSGPEYAGNGGYRGNNMVTGATVVTTNGFSAAASGRVIISSPYVLPVSFLSFTSQVSYDKVLLNWSTASELNTLNFTVERSSNSINWQPLGVIAAAGISSNTKNYSYADVNASKGVNYYRLAQKDVDGNIVYSNIVTATIKSSAKNISIFPNPILNGVLNITVNENTKMELFSNTGKKILEKNLSAGKHTIDVSNLPKGTYYLKSNAESEAFIIQ